MLLALGAAAFSEIDLKETYNQRNNVQSATNDQVETIRKELINLNEQDTQDLMNYVFSEEYSHLDIDTNTNILRKNFNKLIIK